MGSRGRRTARGTGGTGSREHWRGGDNGERVRGWEEGGEEDVRKEGEKRETNRGRRDRKTAERRNKRELFFWLFYCIFFIQTCL